jgi:N-acetylglucosamine-6-phosphate deacetylase
MRRVVIHTIQYDGESGSASHLPVSALCSQRHVTAVPAAVLGADDRLGKLARGYVADAVMLDSSWTSLAVWTEGKRIS